jgi:hypothetical protein
MKWLLRVCLVAGILSLGLLFASLLLKRGGGRFEFSPTSFEHRSETEYYLLDSDIRVFSWRGKPYRMPLVRYWAKQGFFTPPSSLAENWDLITSWQHSTKRNCKGPARAFWHRTGCDHEDVQEEWIEWSHHHPDLAARLWPEVIFYLKRASRGGKYQVCYELAAELMRFVDKCNTTTSFDKSVSRWRKHYQTTLSDIRLP